MTAGSTDSGGEGWAKTVVDGIAEGVFSWVEAQDGERYAPARRAQGG